MNDRLEELRAQRRLIESHLQWLDREIERESVGDAEPSAGDAPPLPADEEPPQAEPEVPDSGESTPADLPEVPEVDHKALKSEIRQGCFIYLALLGAAILFGVIVLYLIYRN